LVGGAMLALSAYVRIQAELSGNLTAAAAVACLSFVWVLERRRRRRQSDRGPSVRSLALRAPWKFVLAACAAFFICTLPWRVYNYVNFGSASWHRIDYYWKYLWMTDDEFLPGAPAQAAAPFAAGRINAACHVFPEECKQLRRERMEKGEQAFSYGYYKKMAIKAFLKRPFRWIAYKMEIFPRYWFSEPTAIGPSGWSWIEGSLTALAVVVSIAGLFLTWRSVLWPTIFASALAVYSSTAATLLFLHLDVRYLYFAREFAVFHAVVVMCALAHRTLRSRAITDANSNA